MKKIPEKVKNTLNNAKLKYILPVVVLPLLLLGAVTVAKSQRVSNVLGEKTSDTENKEGANAPEQVEKVEPTEKPEPAETPEQKEAHEQEAEKVQQEVQKEIQDNNVEKVEVQSTPEKPREGTLKVERTSGQATEKTVPASDTSLISVPSSQAGAVSISVGRNGTVTLVNGGITVQTSYPVVIDPKSQTIAIRTPSGVTVINTLPSQALSGVQATDKPTAIQSAVLGMQNGEAYYDIKGLQTRQFLGIIPVTANVETRINAQNGATISVDKPWYLNTFGFLYSI